MTVTNVYIRATVYIFLWCIEFYVLFHGGLLNYKKGYSELVLNRVEIMANSANQDKSQKGCHHGSISIFVLIIYGITLKMFLLDIEA